MLFIMIAKDLKRFFKDRSAWIVIAAMPIVIMSILGFALQSMFSSGGSDTIERIDIAVVQLYDGDYKIDQFVKDLTASPMGGGMLQGGFMSNIAPIYTDLDPEKLFFDKFLNHPEVAKIVHYELTSLETAEQLIKDDKIVGYVVLPENFKKDMTLNLLTPFRNPVNIEMVPNTERMMGPVIMKALVEGFVDMTDAMIAQKNVVLEQSIAYDLPMNFDGLKNIGVEAEGLKVAAEGVQGSEPVDSKGYYAIAMLSMFLLFAAAQGGTWILEEKSLHTYDRQLVAGYSKWQIALGKLALIYLVLIMQITILIAFSTIVLGVQWGNLANIIIITAASAFGVGGVGILLSVVSSITNNYQLTRIFENGFIQVLALFGGSYLPIDQLPAFFGLINKFLINGAILKAFMYNMMGYSTEELYPQLLIILVNGVLMTLLAMTLFMKKEAKRDDSFTIQKTVDAEIAD